MLKEFVNGFIHGQFINFLGKLLTLADAVGLEEKQGEAYKSLIKQAVWELWEHPKFMEEKELYIPSVDESK